MIFTLLLLNSISLHQFFSMVILGKKNTIMYRRSTSLSKSNWWIFVMVFIYIYIRICSKVLKVRTYITCVGYFCWKKYWINQANSTSRDFNYVNKVSLIVKERQSYGILRFISSYWSAYMASEEKPLAPCRHDWLYCIDHRRFENKFIGL